MPGGILDGQPHVADEHICSQRWSGAPKGEKFRCALCGHKFKPGDTFRFVLTNTKVAEEAGAPGGNLLVCELCDAPNEVIYSCLSLMQKKWEEIRRTYWWFLHDVVER